MSQQRVHDPDASLPSPGSARAFVPPLHRYYQALRLPAGHLAALRFLRLAILRDHAFFAPGVAACGDDGPGVGHSVSPPEFSSVETTGSPKFLGSPHSRLPMFSDPGRPMRSRPRTERSRGPRCLNDEGTDDYAPFEARWHGFRACCLRITVGLPFSAQDSLPGAGQALLSGLSPAGFR